MAMPDPATIEALTRALMLGTGRSPLPLAAAFDGRGDAGDAKAALKAMALLGQRRRFARPAPPSDRGSQAPFADERPILPDAARPLLRSLFAGKAGNAGDVAALAVADAMDRRRLRLHPFDLPRLDAFVAGHRDALGAAAIAWAERNAAPAGPDAGAYAFFETIDESNWMQGRPAQKAAFIRGLRGRDAARARGLVERAFAGEPAPVRVGMVQALATKLGLEDAPFLEGLAKDRAPTVREAAEALLARLPGTAQAARQLQEALSRVKITRAGLLRRRTVLQLDYPATIRDWQRESWALSTLGCLSLDAFVQGLSLSPEDAIAGAADDPMLTAVLATQASHAGRFDLVARLAQAGAAVSWAILTAGDGAALWDQASARAWAAAAIQPGTWKDLPGSLALTQLYRGLRGPLPAPTAAALLGAKALRAFLDTLRAGEPHGAADALTALAALMPAEARGRLQAELAPLAPAPTTRARTLLTALDTIESA